MTEISITLTTEQLSSIIFDLCDLPEKFLFHTVDTKVKLNITQDNSSLEKAKLQETLRKRFSQPERMKMNQQIIKTEDFKNDDVE